MAHAVKVYVGNNVDRYPVTVESTSTLKEVLQNERIDYTRGTMHLDGSSLRPATSTRPLTTSASTPSASC